MSLLTRRALVPGATLLLAVATAQTCYYPDGRSISTDIPCDPSAPASACCGKDSFCLADGLCYGGGLVTRGSCTDDTWNSAACTAYCTSEDTDMEIALTPCTSGGSSNTFVCGVNTTDCQSDSNTFTLSSDTSLVLRPAQAAALLGSSLQTATAPQVTITSIPEGYYTGGAMAGLAIGIALPLLIALGVMYMLLRKERGKFGRSKPNNKLMYKLPDDCQDDFAPKPPPSVTVTSTPVFPTFSSNRSSHVSAATSMATSRRASLRTIQTMSSRPVLSQHFPSNNSPVVSQHFPPGHSQTFLERYETMKRNAQVQSMEINNNGSAHELDSTPTRETPRFELSDTRMST